MVAPLRVLLVDDNPDDRLLVTRQLSRDFSGVVVQHVHDAVTFQQALEKGEFDVVITDYQVRWSDGIYVLRAVKDRFPDCPVIMFTGTGSEEIAVEAMKAGLDDYVLKSVKHLPRLSASVLAALQRKAERRRTQELEARYRQMFTHIPIGVYRATIDGEWLEVNPAALQLFGARSLDDIRGLTVLNAYARLEDREQFLQRLLKENRIVNWRVLLRRLDGTTFWAQVHATLERDAQGNPQFIDGAVMDITPLVAAEAERERLTATLQTLIDHLPEGVALISGDGQVLMANPTAREYFRTLGHRHDRQPLVTLAGHRLTDLLRPFGGTPVELTAEQRVFEWLAQPVPGGNWVVVLREVTAERAMQQRVATQERLAAIGQLAAGIAHDFNNLLAAIIGSCEILLMRADLPHEVTDMLGEIMRQGERAAQLIRKILDFSRQSVTERRPVDLASFLGECVQLLRRLLPENIRLVTDIVPGHYVVDADVVQLQQVITNLAVNARDAMPEGGELRIQLRRLRVSAEYPPPLPDLYAGDWVALSVSDTGTGIPPDILPRIFEPFFTTKEPGKGSGLGLAQVYGIVSQHGGAIDVRSAVNEGTTFTIYLPCTAAPEKSPSEEETAAPLLGRGELVLLVEDDDGVRTVLTRMLERLNYRVVTAANGREALPIYKQRVHDIALVLSDFVMPEMSGDKLLNELRSCNPNVKVVFITGYPLGEIHSVLNAPNIAGWIQKPPRLSMLARVLHGALHPTAP